jgi:hypothetical protein
LYDHGTSGDEDEITTKASGEITAAHSAALPKMTLIE